MKFYKLLIYDITNGLLKNRFLLLSGFFLPLFFCLDMSLRINDVSSNAIASVTDYIIYIYGGMKEYIPDPSEPFTFPIVWTLMILAPAYATLIYPLNDIQTFGQQVLIRSKRRVSWWLSKCCWNIISSLFYHIFVLSITLIFCLLIKVRFYTAINEDMLRTIFRIKDEVVLNDLLELNLYIILVPILISISLNLFQMTLSLFIKPVFSFLVLLMLFISSSYSLTPFLIGNYAMMVRSNEILLKGIDIKLGLIISILLLIISSFVGLLKFRQFDIINKE